MNDYRWTCQNQGGLSSRWYLRNAEHEGHVLSIERGKNGWWIFYDPEMSHSLHEKGNEQFGPFPTFKAAKVAYIVNVGANGWRYEGP